jgi:hypothetical protein
MKKRKDAIAPIVIGSILTIGIIGGGIYYYANKCAGVECTNAAEDRDIQGWTKYSNDQFGYSFYYPKGWVAKESATGVSFTGVKATDDVITITEVTGDVVQDVDSKFGKIVYFYDAAQKVWKVTGTAMGPNGKPIVGVQKATPSSMTVSDLPVLAGTRRFKTNIVPLTSNKFVVLNITGSGYTAVLDPITKTISGGTADVTKLKTVISEGNQALKAQ